LIFALILSIILSIVIGILWANAISKMHEDYPDYKGEDFLDFDK
jgi:hypothetical protein